MEIEEGAGSIIYGSNRARFSFAGVSPFFNYVSRSSTAPRVLTSVLAVITPFLPLPSSGTETRRSNYPRRSASRWERLRAFNTFPSMSSSSSSLSSLLAGDGVTRKPCQLPIRRARFLWNRVVAYGILHLLRLLLRRATYLSRCSRRILWDQRYSASHAISVREFTDRDWFDTILKRRAPFR